MCARLRVLRAERTVISRLSPLLPFFVW